MLQSLTIFHIPLSKIIFVNSHLLVVGNGHGVAYVADTQTNARGSKGRSWDAKSSGNIYVSFIIHREIDPQLMDKVQT